MTEIPDDVMKAAVVAFNTAIDMDGYEGSYEVIARAILAERERCIEILKGFDSYAYVHEAIFLIGGA